MIECLGFMVFGVSFGVVISWWAYHSEVARLRRENAAIADGAVAAMATAATIIAEERRRGGAHAASAKLFIDVELGKIKSAQDEQAQYFATEIAECHKLIMRIRDMCRDMSDGNRYMDSVELALAIHGECEKTGREAQKRAEAYARRAKNRRG